jgi:hypothetical protein
VEQPPEEPPQFIINSLADCALEEKVTPITANFDDLNIYVEHPATTISIRREMINILKSVFKEAYSVELFKPWTAKSSILQDVIRKEVIGDMPLFEFDQY